MTLPTPYTPFPNSFRADLRAGKTLIGCWCSLANPITTEVLGVAAAAAIAAVEGVDGHQRDAPAQPPLVCVDWSATEPVLETR